MKKIVFFNSHPIQYFAPLYKAIAEDNNLDLKVVYFSDVSIKGYRDKQFGTDVKWDIPLLEGYNSLFLKNYSIKPSIYSFWGLQNWGVIKFLFKEPKSVVIVHGWGYFINFIVILFAKLFGHKVAMRGEMPLHQERLKPLRKQRIRLCFFNSFFKIIDFFLFIGNQNKAFYLACGVPDDKLYFTPYAVDNKRFQSEAQLWKIQKNEIKQKLGLDKDTFIIVSSGKYITKKRPVDLVSAVKKINSSQVALILVGEGELREEIEKEVKNSNIKNVFLTGFVNQSEISKYYAIADLYIMPSDNGETWGLSTNEAMNFEVPVVISSMVGCAYDLVDDGINGFIYQVGNIDILTEKIVYFINNPDTKKSAGLRSKEIIDIYSYKTIIANLKKL